MRTEATQERKRQRIIDHRENTAKLRENNRVKEADNMTYFAARLALLKKQGKISQYATVRDIMLLESSGYYQRK